MKHVVLALLFIGLVIGSVSFLANRDIASTSQGNQEPPPPCPAGPQPKRPTPPAPRVPSAQELEEKLKAETAARIKAEQEARAAEEAERARRKEARKRKLEQAEEARRKKIELDEARRTKAQNALEAKRASVKEKAENAVGMASLAVERIQALLALRRSGQGKQDEQRRISQARLEALRRILETKQQAASSIPVETVYVCARCGRDRPSAKPGRCANCGGSTAPDDANKESRARAQQDVAKAQDALTAEAARLQRLSASDQASDAAVLEARLNAMKLAIPALQQVTESCETADARVLADLAQTVAGYAAQIQDALTYAGVPRGEQPPSAIPSTSQPGTTPAAGASPAKRKVYVLANGKKLEVVTEMDAGEELVIKAPDGQIHNVPKKDIVGKE